VRRIIMRSGIITARNPPAAAGPGGRVRSLVTSDGFRVTCDGAEISLHPRTEQRPVTRWKAKIHAPRPERVSTIS
jgi:hypothetical protein